MINSGSIGITFGTTDVFGKIINNTGGQIVLTGNSNTTFYDDVTNDGTLKVSQGSTAVFFGDLQGTHTTGTGTVFIEGDLRPGLFGATLQLAGLLPMAGNSDHHANITNDSGIGLMVTGTNYSLGAIDGVGNTTLSGNSSLTVDSIAQNTLTIGPGAILTIAALAGGPLADTESLLPVPEPSALILLSLAALSLLSTRGDIANKLYRTTLHPQSISQVLRRTIRRPGIPNRHPPRWGQHYSYVLGQRHRPLAGVSCKAATSGRAFVADK